MKKIFIILLILVIIFISLHAGLFVFINLKGKDLITRNIEKEFAEPVTLESLALKFPFRLEMKGFKCGGVSFDEARIVLGFYGPFQFRLAFEKVYLKGLRVRVRKTKRGIKIRPFLIPEKAKSKKESTLPPILKDVEPKESSTPTNKILPADESKAAAKKVIPFKIWRFYIEDGTVEFIDASRKKPIHIVAENITLEVRNISFPELSKAYVDLSASLKSDMAFLKDGLHIKGWIDYLHKDMDVNLNIDSIDYALFSQYYPQFWKPKALSIKEAYLSLTSNLRSESNDLTIKNTLTLDKIEFDEEGGESSRREMAKTIVAHIRGGKDQTSISFTIKTKMVPLVMDFSGIQKNFKASVPMSPQLIIRGLAGKTRRTVSGGVESAKEATGDTLDKAIGAIKSLFDQAKDIFKPSEYKKSEN